jgi:hypothetical protein
MEMKDLYWMSGLVEGEGCFRRAKDLGKGRASGNVQLQIAMTDRDVIERAGRLLRTRVYEYDKAPPRKRIYSVVVSGPRAAGWMMTLYSLMGERRKAKIVECLAAWRSETRKRTHCKEGHALVGHNLYQYTSKRQKFDGRGCRTCRNAASAERMRRVRAVQAGRDQINAKQRAAYHAFIGPRRPAGRPRKIQEA